MSEYRAPRINPLLRTLAVLGTAAPVAYIAAASFGELVGIPTISVNVDLVTRTVALIMGGLAMLIPFVYDK